MKRKKFALIGSAILTIALVGCSLASVLSTVADWTPFAVTTFDGFVALVAPANTALPAEAQNISKLIGDVGTDATAAAQAGGTGVQKVIAAMTAVDSAIPQFETDLTAAGVKISANDQKYVAGAAAFVLATLEGYEAVVQAKAGAAPAAGPTALNSHFALMPVRTPDGCAGFTPASSTPHLETISYRVPQAPLAGDLGGPTLAHLWADCGEKADAIDLYITAKGEVVSAPTATMAKTTVAAKAPPTIANWKRQFNAIAKKYGHPEKQLKLSTRDHFIHVLTLSTR
jgi:hypothetical protein